MLHHNILFLLNFSRHAPVTERSSQGWKGLPPRAPCPRTASGVPLKHLCPCTTSFGWVPPPTLERGLFPTCNSAQALVADTQALPQARVLQPPQQHRWSSTSHRPPLPSPLQQPPGCPLSCSVLGCCIFHPPLLSLFFLITPLCLSSSSTSPHCPPGISVVPIHTRSLRPGRLSPTLPQIRCPQLSTFHAQHTLPSFPSCQRRS